MFTKAATDLWACSKNAAEFLFSPTVLRQNGYSFIPNGIDTSKFKFNPEIRTAVRAELGLTNSFVVGNVGRLCYQKNQSFILDVFSEVVKHRPESRLLLVGEGEQEPELKEKASNLGIADRVVFYGTTDHVEQLMWAMDVFIFPSVFEGLGIVAVEAQAAGLPIFCSEYIPLEAYATPLIRMQPLSAGAKECASMLLSFAFDETDRSEKWKDVADSGYGISDISSLIYHYYTGVQ